MSRGIYQRTEQTRRNMSLARIGMHLSDETKAKMSLANKGKHLRESTKHQISESMLSLHIIPWNKGKVGVLSDEPRKKMGEGARGRVKTAQERQHLSEAHLGRHLPEETKQKISDTLMGRTLTLEHRANISKGNMGRIVSEETRHKISIANREFERTHSRSKEWRQKKSESMKCMWQNLDWRKAHIKNYRGANKVPEVETIRRQKISISTKERWENPEYKERVVEAILKGSAIRPTRPESIVNKLLQKYYPNGWIYNGDFSQGVMINGLVPDFVNVNGKKQVIEVFGSYYHNPDLRKGLKYIRTEQGRIERYEELGFGCLVIWESELGKWRALLRKVKQFTEA